MARTGISRIDDLLDGRASEPVGAAGDLDTVGLIQDLLIGQNSKGLAGIMGAGRGTFGPQTTEAVRQFQQAQGLAETGTIDPATLSALAKAPWARPFACCGYLTLALDVAFTSVVRLVSLTSQFEGPADSPRSTEILMARACRSV
jgi:hypothetical protein